MKKIILLTISLAICIAAQAAFVRNMPVARLQPNGDTLRCYASGDEFYHRLHDADGYTIIQDHATGWYVYADRQWNSEHSDWQLVPTAIVAGQGNPATAGLTPGLVVSRGEADLLHKQWAIPAQHALPEHQHIGTKDATVNHGKLNNIVIFIRFADDSVISTPFSTINGMFNDSSASAVSMHNYFWRASYGQLRIPTYFYPTPSGNTIVSYQDSLPRNYYMPYDATTNPDGYQDNERAGREFGLLQRAVDYVNQNSPVPTSLDIDYDNDGLVDNICFVIKGTYTGWSDLLWPHKWSLYDRAVYINGKRVYTFNLQLEGSGSHYFSTSTFCHEMFHTLGAPDLYHYENYTSAMSVGIWDLMCNNTTPPQHISMYMKMRYGRWLDSVPELTEAGTYSLRSVGDSIPQNNCYRIRAGKPDQWYYLEYRDNTELFEEGLPGSGLIVYRTNSAFNGNANFDGASIFDEVYVFRPGGTDDTTNGTPAQAFFSLESGRTSFTPTSDPSPWLCGGEADTTLYITNIGSAGDSITFTYTPHRPATAVFDSGDCALDITLYDQYADTWNGAYLEIRTASSNPDGEEELIAYLTIGDCRASDHYTVTVGNGPIRLYWNGGAYPNECNFTIRLADGSIWNGVAELKTHGSATIINPCLASSSQHTILVQCADSINNVSGSGLYEYGATARIHAYNMDHYDFVGWHDGPYNGPEDNDDIQSTEKHRDVIVTGDSLFTAIFTKTLHTVNAMSENPVMGDVEGAGRYPYGDTAELTAVPHTGYLFDHWSRGTMLFNDNPLRVVVRSDATYTAHFRSTDGIGELPAQVVVYTKGMNIVVDGTEGESTAIFDVTGRLMVNVPNAGTQTSYAMPQAGVYIVRIGNQQPRKVVVIGD